MAAISSLEIIKYENVFVTSVRYQGNKAGCKLQNIVCSDRKSYD